MSSTTVAPVVVTPEQSVDSLGYRIMVGSELLNRQLQSKFPDRQLTDAQTRIIDFLVASGGSARQRDIQGFLQVSHPTVVGLLKRLVEKGFIRITQSSHDMRANIIVLLDDGQIEYEKVQKHRDEIDALIVKTLNKSESEQLAELLDKVLAALNKKAE